MWLVVAISTLAVGHPVNGEQDRPQKHHEEGKQAPSPSSVPPVTTPPSQPSPQEKEHKPPNEPNKTRQIWQKAFSPESWPNWALVIAGIVGIWAALRTLRAIQRQTDLQGVALRQWVDIKEWRSTPWIPEGGVLSLHIQFDVVNPSERPLTLNGVFIVIGEQQNTISRKNLIPPKKWHPVVVSIKITEEQMLKWNEDKLVFPVSIQVMYEDVLEKMRNQPFSGMIVCSKKNGVVFIPPYGSGLYLTNGENKTPN